MLFHADLKICKGKHPTAMTSAQIPLPGQGKSFLLDLRAAGAYKAASSSCDWEHSDVLSAGWLFSWCEWLNLPDINGDSAIYPSRGFQLTRSVPPKRVFGWLVQPDLN